MRQNFEYQVAELEAGIEELKVLSTEFLNTAERISVMLEKSAELSAGSECCMISGRYEEYDEADDEEIDDLPF